MSLELPSCHPSLGQARGLSLQEGSHPGRQIVVNVYVHHSMQVFAERG